MSGILACIVTYNPELELLASNINSIIGNVDHLVIVDNHSDNFQEFSKKVLSVKVSCIANQENIGIAAALNQGLDMAVAKNMKYLLTMDQDSFFDEGGLEKLKSRMKEMDIDVAMIGPSMRDMNSNFTETFSSEINFVKTIITSGVLCDVKILKKIGGWEEKLFIDKVDFDICYKLLLNNYKIVKINNIFLNHNLGDSRKKNFLINFLITNHSALRVYYQFRNTVYLQKKYLIRFPADMIRLIFSDWKKIIGIILFENNKTKKIRYAIKGFFDGINSNFGKKR